MLLLKNVLQCSFSGALKYILCVCVHLRSKKEKWKSKRYSNKRRFGTQKDKETFTVES